MTDKIKLSEMEFNKLVIITRLDDRFMTAARKKDLLKGLTIPAQEIASVIMQLKTDSVIDLDVLNKYREVLKDVLCAGGRLETAKSI